MTARNIFKKEEGFTLIELLVVIGILAILLAITLIAINPARQFGQANDTKRRSDINAILNAIGQYEASNGGNLPASVAGLTVGTARDLSSDATAPSLAALCADLVPTYIPALPEDPSVPNSQAGVDQATCASTTAWDTKYTITLGANNRITISATGYDGTPITVTR
jgi:prepilin-type N-terminal cleavage/methylation domain-containing protein